MDHTPRIMPSLEHWDYDELDGEAKPCRCFLCVGARSTRLQREDAQRLREGQPFISVTPETDAWKRKIRAHLEAQNKRDLYSELSFLLRGYTWKTEVLKWVLEKILDLNWRHPYWWVRDTELKSLGSWVEDWYEETRNESKSFSRIMIEFEAPKADFD